LLTERIKWNSKPESAEAPEEDDEDDDYEQLEELRDSSKHFVLSIWKGLSAKRSYQNFRVYPCTSESQARKYLSDKGMGHLWDLASSMKFSDTG
jgi:hypothetical protein